MKENDKNQNCTVVFFNGTPRDAGVTIMEIGVKWFFKGIDGQPNGRSDQANRRVALAGGERTSLTSSFDECTYQVLCIIDVELSNGRRGRLSDTVSSGPGACLVNVPFGLVPRAAAISELEKDSPSIEAILSTPEMPGDDGLGLAIDAHPFAMPQAR